MKIEIKILNKEFYHKEKLGGGYYDFPQYQTEGSAALDLVCTEDVTIGPNEIKTINTGIAIWIGSSSADVVGLVVPRSGLGTKGLVLANTIGVIDEDYQGELKIAAYNRTFAFPETFKLKAGDRIAQLMFIPVIKAYWDVVKNFNDSTQRGSSGFGSTGR